MNFFKRLIRKDNIFVLIIALAIALFAIVYAYNYAERYTDERLSVYNGLPREGGFPMSTYDQKNYSQDEFNFRSYSDDEYESRRGIDVSEHQGEIDWKKVKESGVEFAMIRVGYRSYESGDLFEDSRFQENLKGALKNDIDVGIYFFSQAITTDEAIEEARFCCKAVKGKKIDMPIAFDMEPITSGTDRIGNLTMLEKTEIAEAFCQVVDNHGYKSLIYGNPSWILNSLNLSLLNGRDLWLANYGGSTAFPYNYVMWQYSDGGGIDGIDYPTDLNIQYIKKVEGNEN